MEKRMQFSLLRRYSKLLINCFLSAMVVMITTGCEIAPESVKFRTYSEQPNEVCEGTGCKELPSEEHE